MELETKQIPSDELGADESESQELRCRGTQNDFGMKEVQLEHLLCPPNKSFF